MTVVNIIFVTPIIIGLAAVGAARLQRMRLNS